MRRSFRTRVFFPGGFPELHPGLVCEAPSGPLTDGVGSVLDREVYFPLAGYADPGFHTWPSGHIPQDTAPNPLLRSRSLAKKTFGEAFGAATVAGYVGPGFHTWPSGHIPQDNGSESAFTQPVPC
jgi:hypothetical protein